MRPLPLLLAALCVCAAATSAPVTVEVSTGGGVTLAPSLAAALPSWASDAFPRNGPSLTLSLSGYALAVVVIVDCYSTTAGSSRGLDSCAALFVGDSYWHPPLLLCVCVCVCAHLCQCMCAHLCQCMCLHARACLSACLWVCLSKMLWDALNCKVMAFPPSPQSQRAAW